MDAHMQTFKMYEVWSVIFMLMVQLKTDFSRKQLYTKLEEKRETLNQAITTGEVDRAARADSQMPVKGWGIQI